MPYLSKICGFFEGENGRSNHMYCLLQSASLLFIVFLQGRVECKSNTEMLGVGGMDAGCVGFRKFCVIAQQVKASVQPSCQQRAWFKSVHLLKKVGSIGGGCCVPAHPSFSSLHSPVPRLCSRRYLWPQAMLLRQQDEIPMRAPRADRTHNEISQLAGFSAVFILSCSAGIS